jgi:hypothetical protein
MLEAGRPQTTLKSHSSISIHRLLSGACGRWHPSFLQCGLNVEMMGKSQS